MTSLFQYLHDSLKVTPTNDDQLEVTVTLPTDHFLHYVRLLDSLTGFVHVINKHARLERLKDKEYAEYQAKEAERNLARYHERLAELFDHYTSQGLDRKATVKQISADLRKEKHPWSSPDLVRPSLVKAGRGGRPGRPRRQP